jgi:hypothetical protein
VVCRHGVWPLRRVHHWAFWERQPCGGAEAACRQGAEWRRAGWIVSAPLGGEIAAKRG